MKIGWHSAAPFAATGYGSQTALVTRWLKAAGHDVAVFAYYGLKGSIMEWEGIRVYPGDTSGYGGVMLPHMVSHFGGGKPEDVLLITLQDVWTLTQHYEKLAPLRLASWTPVDCKPFSPRVLNYFELTSATPIAMSRFGEAEMRNAGLEPLYVPHMIDTRVFNPDRDRSRTRDRMKVARDAFVVGMVANNAGTNPPRKAFPQVFQAFSYFREQHGDAVLYLHSDVFGLDDGINLMALKEFYGIPDEAFAMSSQLGLFLGMGAENVADLYNAFDVLASPSYGEGFGIPIVEAQACGCPVITSNWTSMPELTCAGWAVSGEPFYVPQYGADWLSPSIGEIYGAMEAAYEARGDRELRARGVEFAAQYDVERVMREFWVPALEQLGGPREVPALPNSAQRRSKGRKVAA